MSGINAGVLSNAYPLTHPQIAQLEKDVIENNAVYAYVDDTGDLCFAMRHGVNGIRDLAWHNAYELSNENGALMKKTYKKTGLKTFTLDKTYTKTQLEDSWVVAGVVFEFDGDFSKYPTFDLGSDEFTVAKLVRVSDRVFSMQELSSSTVTGYFGGPDGLQSVDGSALTALEEYDPDIDVTLRRLSADPDGVQPFVCVWENYSNNEACPATGTYFLYVSQDETFGHARPIYNVLYTKSISCLTTADALQPTERLEGDGQEFYTAAPSTLSFRSTAPLNEFQDVQINGQTVDPSNYTLEEGSTIVKLSHEYLKTLDAGSYELSIISNSKTVKGGFTVAAPELNEHGFYYDQPYYGDLQMFCGFANGGCRTSILFHRDGTASIYQVDSSNSYETTFTYEDGIITFEFFSDQFEGTHIFSGNFSDNGKAFSGEIAFTDAGWFGSGIFPDIAFSINTEQITSDTVYVYYRWDVDTLAWEYFPINRTLSSYPAAKTDIWNLAVTDIAYEAFMGCSALETVEIANSVTRIGNCAFLSSGLRRVTIPLSVKTIAGHAFSCCANLTSINFEGTMNQWNAINKGNDWHANTPATYVQCSDGIVNL